MGQSINKQKVLLTGAAGGMGSYVLDELIKRRDLQSIRGFVLDSDHNRKKMYAYEKVADVFIQYGDLTNYEQVLEAVKDMDLILHVAALVSPTADDYPDLAMKVNVGSMKNIIKAIKYLGQEEKTKVVFIGTVAQTGDRMPPIHWGRVGDPIKTSYYDYYAVSKVAAERELIESGIKYWVSLRQTGIMGQNMVDITDPIMFHNCLNNVLEYVSDKDSGRLLGNLSYMNQTKELSDAFWCHIYNIGGGEKCRTSTLEMFEVLYGKLGFKDMNYVIDTKLFATKNFHGQYYLDSDDLEEFLHFRQDGLEYFYDLYLKKLGFKRVISTIICKVPGGQWFMGKVINRSFHKIASRKRGTIEFIKGNKKNKINAYWGSKEQWDKLPKTMDQFEVFRDWDQVVKIDHGYDEEKPAELLDIEDLQQAATFRGGQCISSKMVKGDWKTKIEFKCAFEHTFSASPSLVLEGGHWCPHCESQSWDHGKRAKVDPFFAQVWHPIHDSQELDLRVLKV